MNLEPREAAVAESYATFWDETPPAPPAAHTDDAYTTFVNLTENDLPTDTPSEAD